MAKSARLLVQTPMSIRAIAMPTATTIIRLALPPAFRLMSLPEQRQVRLPLNNTHDLKDALCFMSYLNFSGKGKTLKGDPVQ